MDDVDVWLNRILCSDADPVLVGHLPFLGKLASKLVATDENMQIVSFQNGGMVCLEDNNDNKNFSVKWAITPDMII
jgi:phosphohistidine phosphatase